MVYVLNIEGKPLMPCKPAKARKLLKANRAKVVKRTPFTIQLLFECENITQPIILGIDAGSKVVGLSASTENTELYRSETTLRTDIVELLSERRSLRRTRRSRKTRYRQARFLNRARTNEWLAPSVQHKISSHLRLVADVHEILPITQIIVEVASFDIQKIKNPEIQGKEYQEGEQLNFWNVREYVLFRDGHKCCGRKGCKNKILNVHHIESRKIGGDAPNNLITLCEDCHKAFHAGKLKLDLKRGSSFRDAAFMGIMRWFFYNRLKELYPNVSITYGYITKNVRIRNNLEKTHGIDAYCIAGNLNAMQTSHLYRQKFVRKSNRSLHKVKVLKGGLRKANKAEQLVQGFRLFDKVLLDKQECFIFGRRKSGYFDVRLLDGTKLSAGISHKKVRFKEVASTLLATKTTIL